MKRRKQKSDYRGSLGTAWKTSCDLIDFVFHVGYQGIELPRPVRKLIAKSAIHRAWFSGFTGLGIMSIMELMQADDLDNETNF